MDYLSKDVVANMATLQGARVHDYTCLCRGDLIRVKTSDGYEHLLAVSEPCTDRCNVEVEIETEAFDPSGLLFVLNGSSWGGSMIRAGAVVIGMHLALAVCTDPDHLWIGDWYSNEIVDVEIERDSVEARRILAKSIQ